MCNHINLHPSQLYQEIIKNNEGELTASYAINIKTGIYTGRSPNDKYIVVYPEIHDKIDWGDINKPTSVENYKFLYKKIIDYVTNQTTYTQYGYAGADNKHRIKVKVVSTAAYHALFAYNMFLRPDTDDVFEDEDFTIIAAPNLHIKDSPLGETFIVLNLIEKVILIAGTLYSGEIKKGIFTVMNYLLPQKGVLSMHCSTSINSVGESDIFFGLSGTGKTTLSSSLDRVLIGDDEHGWGDDGVFNIEGGCYAKVINLDREKEPMIYKATENPGTILENVVLNSDRNPDFTDKSLTVNTRCSYPITVIENAIYPGITGHPSNIVLLTCDAFGVLPPISKLTTTQAVYYFLTGYTSKVAGTELGILDPEATFSPCYGAPFMPLRPQVYANLLRDKINKHNCCVWLINTGWIFGPYGVGERIPLKYTRKMLEDAVSGRLTEFKDDPIFDLAIPTSVDGIPNNILHPCSGWSDPRQYYMQAQKLKVMFNDYWENNYE